MSAKTLSNLKSGVARALVVTGIVPQATENRTVSEGWTAFLGSALQKHQRYSLSRFAVFCTARGIQPAGVDDALLGEYHTELDLTLIGNDPEKVVRETVQTFNRILRDTNVGRPQLTPITKKRFRCRPIDLYPSSLRADLQSYLDRLAQADLLSEDGPVKALRPTSIRNVEAHVRQHLDALVSSGHHPSTFQTLADAVHPNAVRQGLGFLIDRNGGQPPVGLKNLAGTLLGIARHYAGAPDDHVAFLKKTVAKLGGSRATPEWGMSEKNVKRLGQFDDWANVVRLIALPEGLLNRARANPSSHRSALDAMFATAIAILLACPMRARNLASLDLDRHLSFRMNGRKKAYALRIEGKEVKNGTTIEIDLGEHASDILIAYLKEFRSLLSADCGTALFPQRSGGPRAPGSFSQDLARKVYRETGLVVHGHLFRHIAAKLYLDRKPGDFETVRRMLGHKKLDTTMRFYARLESKAAFKQYDEAVLADYRGGRRG